MEFLLVLFVGLGDSDYWLMPNQCGAWAVFQSASASGASVSRLDVETLLPSDGRPKSFAELASALKSLGVPSLAVRYEDRRLPAASGVAILALRASRPPEELHYVTAVGWADGSALAVDGPFGRRWVSRSEIQERWMGDALLVGARSVASCGPGNAAIWKTVLGWGLIFSSLAWVLFALAVRSRRTWTTLAIIAVAGCDGRSRPQAVLAPTAARVEVEPGSSLVATLPEKVADEGGTLLTTGTAEFTLRNRGSGPIRVKGFDSTCGCLVLEDAARTLEPGRAERFKVLVRGDAHQDWRGVVTVRFDDPHVRPMPIEILRRGRVFRQELVGSRQLSASGPIDFDETSFEIRLRTREIDPQERWISSAKSATADRPWPIHVERVYRRQGGVTVDYIIRANLSHRDSGRHAETVELFDRTGKRIDAIQVAFERLSRFRAAPPVITAVAAKDKPIVIERTVLLSHKGGDAQDLVKAISQFPPWLEIRVEPRGDTVRALRVKIDPKAASFGPNRSVAHPVVLQWGGGDTVTLPVSLAMASLKRGSEE